MATNDHPDRHTHAATAALRRGLCCVMVVLGLGISGCSGNAGAMTCREYGGLSSSDKASTLRSLLRSHDLDPNASSNILGATRALSNFCGVSVGRATRNLDRPLDEATNWSSSYW